MNFKAGHVATHSSAQPPGMELGRVSEDGHAAHARALQHGAQQPPAPSSTPRGQTLPYVRCPDGPLVTLCTPLAG